MQGRGGKLFASEQYFDSVVGVLQEAGHHLICRLHLGTPQHRYNCPKWENPGPVRLTKLIFHYPGHGLLTHLECLQIPRQKVVEWTLIMRGDLDRRLIDSDFIKSVEILWDGDNFRRMGGHTHDGTYFSYDYRFEQVQPKTQPPLSPEVVADEVVSLARFLLPHTLPRLQDLLPALLVPLEFPGSWRDLRAAASEQLRQISVNFNPDWEPPESWWYGSPLLPH